MKDVNEYIIVNDSFGKPVFVLEFNETKGEARLTVKVASNENMILVKECKIVRGIEGYGAIHYNGSNFNVTVAEHEFFVQEYPDMEALLAAEYVAADRWLTKKKKKIKDSYRFILNWIRKARKAW